MTNSPENLPFGTWVKEQRRALDLPVWVEDSRPSHINVLKNRRFAVGKGRRYTDSVAGSLQPYGFTTPTTLNSAFAGTLERDTDQAPIRISRL